MGVEPGAEVRDMAGIVRDARPGSGVEACGVVLLAAVGGIAWAAGMETPVSALACAGLVSASAACLCAVALRVNAWFGVLGALLGLVALRLGSGHGDLALLVTSVAACAMSLVRPGPSRQGPAAE